MNGDLLNGFNTSGLDQNGLPSFAELVRQATSGELDLSLSNIIRIGSEALFKEFFSNNVLIKQLLIIVLISAVLGVLSEAFKHKSAGELGFYITVCMVGLLAVSSFQLCASLLSDLAQVMRVTMEASVPLMLSMMAVSGGAASAAVFSPILFFSTQFLAQVITLFFIPLVTSAACLHMINFITETNRLDKLARALKKFADWTLRIIVALFAAVLTLQKISIPAVNNAVLKTAKGAVGAVPVVGSALNAAVDTVVYWGQAAKSGVLVALVVTLCAAMVLPILKMAVLTFIFRLAAIVAQPLCEERLVRSLEGVSEYMGSLIGAGALLAAAGAYTVLVLLSF